MTETPFETFEITDTTIMPGTPEYEESAKALDSLASDPNYMIALHTRQIERLVLVVEEMAQRLLELEERINSVDELARFPGSDSPILNEPGVSTKLGLK
jgi:hypothetical protein